MLQGLYTDFFTGLFLVAHVDMRRGIISDYNHRQSRRQTPAPLETFDFFFDLFLDFFRDGFAVDDPGHDLLRDKIENLYRKKSACKALISSLHDTVVFKRQHLCRDGKTKFVSIRGAGSFDNLASIL